MQEPRIINPLEIQLNRCNALLVAIQRNKPIEEITRLLEEGAVPNSSYDDGNGCLHWAVKNNRPDLVKLLLMHKAEYTSQNKDKETPAHLGGSLKHWDCLKEIIQFYPKTDEEDSVQYSKALLWAVYYDQPCELIKSLLEAGAKPRAAFRDTGDSCLHYAVRNNRPDLVKLLLEKDADHKFQNKKGNTPAYLAGLLKQWDCLQEIIQFHPKTDENDSGQYDHALLWAVYYDQPCELIKSLLEAGAKPRAAFRDSGDSCLHCAVRHNRIDLVMLLLRHGCDKQYKNKKGETPVDLVWEAVPTSYFLYYAIIFNLPEKITQIMDDIEKNNELAKIITKEPITNETLLQIAQHFLDSGILATLNNRFIQLLLQAAQEPDMNSQDEFKETCSLMSELLFAQTKPKNDSSENENKAILILILIFSALAGEKVNAKIKLYAYQTLAEEKGLDISLDSKESLEYIENLFLRQKVVQKVLEEEGGVIEQLQAFSATNLAANQALAQFYLHLGDDVRCFQHLKLAHQQDSNNPIVITLIKQLIQVSLPNNRGNANYQTILNTDNQSMLIQCLTQDIMPAKLLPGVILKLWKGKAEKEELIILAEIHKSKLDQGLGNCVRNEESLKLIPLEDVSEIFSFIDFYRYAVQVIQEKPIDDRAVIAFNFDDFEKIPLGYCDHLIDLFRKGTPAGIKHLIQDAIQCNQINLIKIMQRLSDDNIITIDKEDWINIYTALEKEEDAGFLLINKPDEECYKEGISYLNQNELEKGICCLIKA